MRFSRADLINLASALWLQMCNPHIPKDTQHYQELADLYNKLYKEIEDDQDN